ncbi:MAG: FMN-dependent NADH-azoreductase [Planctomycetota bacterium]|jgi:FMN-dependent NADH-azoreductase|nr:FMN-dependent NADH-azoreductase [Planctomycetota bacterium]
MSRLLFIAAHPLTAAASKTLAVAEVFLDAYRERHGAAAVTTLNLFAETIPALTGATFDAWKKIKTGAALTDLPPAEQQEMARHHELLTQFLAHDKYVFANPLWNFFLPPVAKQYIDLLCVSGKTFRYTPNGPVGLLPEKKVLHIQSAGGVYDRGAGAANADFADAYLRHLMKFFGIADFSGIYIDGGDAFPQRRDAIVAEAKEAARELAAKF